MKLKTLRPKQELIRSEIKIDPFVQVDCDTGKWILCIIELTHNVAEKFGFELDHSEESMLMFGRYDPFTETLNVECEITKGYDPILRFDYDCTTRESIMIRRAIKEAIMEVWGKTPQRYCMDERNHKNDLVGKSLMSNWVI